jgi:anti-sigma factor RsiW
MDGLSTEHRQMLLLISLEAMSYRELAEPAAAMAAGSSCSRPARLPDGMAKRCSRPGIWARNTLVANAAAHPVYAVEVHHPVKVPASEQDPLATWLGRG